MGGLSEKYDAIRAEVFGSDSEVSKVLRGLARGSLRTEIKSTLRAEGHAEFQPAVKSDPSPVSDSEGDQAEASPAQ